MILQIYYIILDEDRFRSFICFCLFAGLYLNIVYDLWSLDKIHPLGM